MNNIEYPIRINRYLYLKNICSRREADKLIEKGLITVNGKKAKIGQKVNESDKIVVADSVKQKKQERVYVAVNKPIGVVSHNPQMGEQSVSDLLPEKYQRLNLAPLGRLDKASHGLMIMSNDGTIVDKLLNPKFSHEKVYEVEVDKHLNKHFYDSMEYGVDIEGYKTKPAKISKIANKKFLLTLTEGKKHQIRRMCAALGYQVQDLKRTQINTVRLGTLGKGKTRDIKGLELLSFLKSINAIK